MPVLAQVCIYRLNTVMLSFICKYRPTVGKVPLFSHATQYLLQLWLFLCLIGVQTSFETFNLWKRIVPINQGHDILYFICKHNKCMNELRIKTKKAGLHTKRFFFNLAYIKTSIGNSFIGVLNVTF